MLRYIILACSTVFLCWGQVMFTPPVPQVDAITTADPNCADKLANCPAYGKSTCSGTYSAWARQNCPVFCGFCHGVVATEKPCVDNLQACERYGKSVCSDPTYTGWVSSNCKYYCRQCSAAALALADSLTTTTTTTQPTTTTVAPENCIDRLDCKLFGQTSCGGKFEAWARNNCMNYCGYCKGPPTPPPVCVDNLPNCSNYGQATCAKSEYEQWAKQYCMKFCGLCGNQGGGVPTPMGKRSAKE